MFIQVLLLIQQHFKFGRERVNTATTNCKEISKRVQP